MAPSMPWAIVSCVNVCIICHLAFCPVCGCKRPTVSSSLQCFWSKNTDPTICNKKKNFFTQPAFVVASTHHKLVMLFWAV